MTSDKTTRILKAELSFASFVRNGIKLEKSSIHAQILSIASVELATDSVKAEGFTYLCTLSVLWKLSFLPKRDRKPIINAVTV